MTKSLTVPKTNITREPPSPSMVHIQNPEDKPMAIHAHATTSIIPCKFTKSPLYVSSYHNIYPSPSLFIIYIYNTIQHTPLPLPIPKTSYTNSFKHTLFHTNGFDPTRSRRLHGSPPTLQRRHRLPVLRYSL